MNAPRDAPPLRHSVAEDAHALALSAGFVAFGLILLHTAGLVTGGVAGIALTVSYATGVPIGPLFIILNLPFFVLARRRMGWPFTVKSLGTMAMLTVLASAIPHWIELRHVDPAFAATFGGSLIGMGILSLARHRASVGGIGIVALFAQERHGVSAGLVQLSIDVTVIIASALVIAPVAVAWSALSAVTMGVVVIVYHRPGRYAGH